MLQKEKIDVLFCTEVNAMNVVNNFNINDYETHYPLTNKSEKEQKIRILAVSKETPA